MCHHLISPPLVFISNQYLSARLKLFRFRSICVHFVFHQVLFTQIIAAHTMSACVHIKTKHITSAQNFFRSITSICVHFVFHHVLFIRLKSLPLVFISKQIILRSFPHSSFLIHSHHVRLCSYQNKSLPFVSLPVGSFHCSLCSFQNISLRINSAPVNLCSFQNISLPDLSHLFR